MPDLYSRLAARALADEAPEREECAALLDEPQIDLLSLVHAAYQPRRAHFGRKVMVHVLNNAQNGLCPEDCGYCAQNKDSEAPIRKYKMKSDAELLAAAEAAARAGASRYCMAISGRGPTIQRAHQLAGIVRKIKERYPIEICISGGLLGDEHARILADAGLDRFNHNLNTSAAHYDKICTTHTYQDRLDTLHALKRNGIEPCSGLIVGMGERTADLVDVAFELRRLEVPSIPMNFLIPIEGNQVTSDGSLTPERCLRAVCMMRLVNPRAELRLAGGREGHLRALGVLALWPANSLFVEGYLTTRGDAVRDTYQMIRDAGFEVEGNPLYARESDAPEFDLRDGGTDLFRPEVRA